MRQDALSSIARALSAVTSRRVSVAVGLWGEPGIGKTHAALEVLRNVPCHSIRLHATMSSAQLVAALPRPNTLPGWTRAQLEQVLSGETLVAATLAATIAASAPFVLHLEDVHEADPERLELIETLARTVVKTRGVGLLVTSRTELSPSFLSHRLKPLSLPETAVLMIQELRGEAPRDSLEWVFARTRGNPLFALEFARYLRRQGFLWSDGERWHWREPSGGFIPVTVEALILELVSRMVNTPEARAVLEARAILPNTFESARLEAVWAEIAGVNPAALELARNALERGGMLSAESIAHPLFAELVRRNLGQARRTLSVRALHALAPSDPVLAAEYAQDAGLGPEETADWLEQAALRLFEADDGGRSVRLLMRAADCASGERQATLALTAARRLRGVNVLEWERMSRLAMRWTAFRQEATFLCATAMQGDGRHDEAWQLLESLPEADRSGPEWWQMRLQFHASAGHPLETVRVWDERTDLQNLASALSRFQVISCLLDLSETGRAESMIETALAAPDLSPRDQARFLDRRNFIHYREARYEAVEGTLSKILDSMDETAPAPDRAIYYVNRSHARTRLGKYLEARQDAERACKLALASGSGTYGVGFPTALALAQIYLHEFVQAEQTLLEATALAQHHSHERLWDCYGHLSFLYLRWNPPYGPMLARRYARLSLELVRGLEHDGALLSALEDCCRAERLSGDYGAALSIAQELERLAQRTGLRGDEIAATTQMGCALAQLGQREQALPYLRRGVELLEGGDNHSDTLNLALEIDRLEGDAEAARHKLEWFEAHGDTDFAAKVRLYFPQLVPEPELPTQQAASTARLNVLGPMTLERGGQPVPSRAHKRLEILAYLLETRIAGRGEASALELLDALYPGESEPEARHTLKQQVYLIRSSLGAESVLSTSSGYALGAVSSDAEDFLRSSEAALWRGGYLAGLGEGWRGGVREALILALHSSIKARLSPDPREAARLGAVLCEMEPFDAAALHLWVRSLEAAGEARAARRGFEQGRTRLREVGQVLPQTLEEFVSTQVLT